MAKHNLIYYEGDSDNDDERVSECLFCICFVYKQHRHQFTILLYFKLGATYYNLICMIVVNDVVYDHTNEYIYIYIYMLLI